MLSTEVVAGDRYEDGDGEVHHGSLRMREQNYYG
jgi:hypothetical protein